MFLVDSGTCAKIVPLNFCQMVYYTHTTLYTKIQRYYFCTAPRSLGHVIPIGCGQEINTTQLVMMNYKFNMVDVDIM